MEVTNVMIKHSFGSLVSSNFTLKSLERQEHSPRILTNRFLSFLHLANVDSLTFACIQKINNVFSQEKHIMQQH